MNETRSFEHAPESVAAARRFATELLAELGDADALQAIELMVSELATNCIRHTDSAFHLTIVSEPDRVRVAATDQGAGEPSKRSPQPTEPTGRGLQIVNMLSSDWGYDSAVAGKTVWFTLETGPASPVGDPRRVWCPAS